MKGIEVIDMVKLARDKKSRTEIFNTKRMHAWVHYYPNPGDKDALHCHNADQTFYVIEGECTMRFPDGGQAVLKPGMAATIRGGSFYQLENTGCGPMIMMGNRSGPSDAIQIIDFVTRKDLRPLYQRDPSADTKSGSTQA
jgi:mannose-6-phosphate isomerase-like protein (cupin superfamily)